MAKTKIIRLMDKYEKLTDKLEAVIKKGFTDKNKNAYQMAVKDLEQKIWEAKREFNLELEKKEKKMNEERKKKEQQAKKKK